MGLLQSNLNAFSKKTINSILRHDHKVSSYKSALVRAINDLVLGFLDLRSSGQDVAVPLALLAEFWLAYYWPGVPVTHIRGRGQYRPRPFSIICRWSG